MYFWMMLLGISSAPHFTLSYSSLIFCIYFLYVCVSLESFGSKPMWHYLCTESGGMRYLWIGGGRCGLGDYWLLSLASGITLLSSYVLDSLLSCD